MTRLVTGTIGTGVPVPVSALVGLDWDTLAQARDFSVPDPSQQFAVRDPADPQNRTIRPGQIEFLTDIMVRNMDTEPRWLDLRVVLEDGATRDVPGRHLILPQVTMVVPMRGMSLVKLDYTGVTGMSLEARAEVAGQIVVWATGLEGEAASHEEDA